MAQKYIKPTGTPAARPSILGETKTTTAPAKIDFVFSKINYQILAVSVALVAFGFVLMSGSTDIYSNTKIVIAPLIVLAGFGVGFYAIMKRPTA